jgi:UDP-N-acetylglucosamine diphosphorylase / glucose-1-phosphate thymidylyltransferase / UDP-N-acetylgalactosamine diphosphorylase / glucosamine-1-phosphate N-acetyltransferase / galactosamine-1-phosphate N-acetyltransferase
MQCIILAAGKGTRMRPLTDTIPKPLVPVCGKPLLEHIVDALPSSVDELIIVIGYKGEMIQAHCGTEFKGKRVQYVVQENPKAGTADAVMQTKGIAKGKFMVVYADDIHGATALKKIGEAPAGMLVARSDTPEKFGVVIQHDDGTLKAIIEKPEVPPSNLVNIGGFVLTDEIFEIETELSALGEYLLTDSVTEFAKRHPVFVVEQDTWIPVGCPEDIPMAEAVLCAR